MQSSNRYQLAMIGLLLLITALISVFVYRELFPEYKLYQNRYVELEELRSEYTKEPPPPFRSGISQIVLKPKDKGPETIDRCTSCHVAMKLEHFSKTRVKKDLNGEVVLDAEGFPVLEENPSYVFKKLEDKIASLKDVDSNEAERLEGLKVFKVGHFEYDATKVLAMHPLIGKEERPFELHAVEEAGCTSCHNGNGRGLTTAKAHGPVYDGQYHAAPHGPSPKFLEKDSINDPKFAKVFNHKPGHDLLFQTEPLFTGDLMEAKCIQCHNTLDREIENTTQTLSMVTRRKEKAFESVKNAFEQELDSTIALLSMKNTLLSSGVEGVKEELDQRLNDLSLNEDHVKKTLYNLRFVQEKAQDSNRLKKTIDQELENLLGSLAQSDQLSTLPTKKDIERLLDLELETNQENRSGSLQQKKSVLNRLTQEQLRVDQVHQLLAETLHSKEVKSALLSDLDLATQNYHRGEELFLSQACYACHRIEGLARGGVGPDLTQIGLAYPWYVKESIVWPQADLASSVMPNFKIDHEELEDLMTYLMAQTGESQAISPLMQKVSFRAWMNGEKRSFEKPVDPALIEDVDLAKEVFATQGCASCHRLKGFKGQYDFYTSQNTFEDRFKEREWFKKLFPEGISGSAIVARIENNKDLIDQKIIPAEGSDHSILAKLEKKHPQLVESFYSNFKFASRAKSQSSKEEQKEWKLRVNKVLDLYVQEYGFGRLIAPRLNWSGVLRSKEWLFGHFLAPTKYIAKSIMPVLPFDKSKFYSLTYMLQETGLENQKETRQEWQQNGFDPEIAYNDLCASCHGSHLQGNGPVAQWIYPIPKNLRNATFLRNLTKEKALESILYGVKGTPMPAWGEGEHPVLSKAEAMRLVDWLFESLPGSEVIKDKDDVLKWQYTPEDVIKEMQEEGGHLKSSKSRKQKEISEKEHYPSLREMREELSLLGLETGDHLFASLNPTVSAGEDPIFDEIVSNENNRGYYIKEKYYTEENKHEGQKLFVEHCAVCHGREGQGNGARAESMSGAKPRMLTNLPWIETRDDLRLLRSIKYGVSGTSMTPWGDYTTTLQRLQLVIYIRSLNQEKELKEHLYRALYQVFDQNLETLLLARKNEAVKSKELKIALEEITSERKLKEQKLSQGLIQSSLVSQLYVKELDLREKIAKKAKREEIFSSIAKIVEDQKKLNKVLGDTLISRDLGSQSLKLLSEMILLSNTDYLFDGNRLILEFKKDQSQELFNDLVSIIDGRIETLLIEKKETQARLSSAEKQNSLEKISTKLKGLMRLKSTLFSSKEELKQLQKQEQERYLELKEV